MLLWAEICKALIQFTFLNFFPPLVTFLYALSRKQKTHSQQSCQAKFIYEAHTEKKCCHKSLPDLK